MSQNMANLFKTQTSIHEAACYIFTAYVYYLMTFLGMYMIELLKRQCHKIFTLNKTNYYGPITEKSLLFVHFCIQPNTELLGVYAYSVANRLYSPV